MDPEADPYLLGWAAVSRHLRRGLSWSGHERDTAYQGLGGGQFLDVSWVSGLDLEDDGRSVLPLDLDYDGDLDLLRSGRGEPRLRILENRLGEAERRPFVALRLLGPPEARDGIGARIEVRDGVGLQVRTRRAGDGFLGQTGPWEHLAARGDAPLRVTVTWPDGEREDFEGVMPNGWFTLARGRGSAVRWTPPSAPSREGESSPAASGGMGGRVVLRSPLPLPALRGVEGTGIARALAPARAAGPTVLALFSADCGTCVAELPALARAAEEWRRDGVRVLALHADPETEALRGQGLLLKAGWGGGYLRAEEQTLRILEAVEGLLSDSDAPLALPSLFVLDPRGRLVVLHRGAPDLEQVTRDLGFANDVEPAVRRRLAGLAGGRWFEPAEELGAEGLVELLHRRGLAEPAEELARRALAESGRWDPRVLLPVIRTRWAQGDRAAARSLCARLLAESPADVEALRLSASMATVEGDWLGAVAAWRALERLQPESAEVLLGLTFALVQAGEQASAGAARARLEALSPEAAQQLDQMLRAFERKAADLDPDEGR
ncbi:MAG: ASPIC/UnbV domain-containing protein [Planctomycetes bacterium]|nr:ASPIC/UnbV domain-containing protein [Planctomycetota bacterium]